MSGTATLACAKPSRQYPEGRTGISAGYHAHKRAGEEACAPCLDAYTSGLVEWRSANRDTKRAYERGRRQRRQELVEVLKDAPCTDCGGSFPPECMDFDHLGDDKLYGIAQMSTRSLQSLLAEIDKCDLVCANCHRIRTRKRANAERPEVVSA